MFTNAHYNEERHVFRDKLELKCGDNKIEWDRRCNIAINVDTHTYEFVQDKPSIVVCK